MNLISLPNGFRHQQKLHYYCLNTCTMKQTRARRCFVSHVLLVKLVFEFDRVESQNSTWAHFPYGSGVSLKNLTVNRHMATNN